MSELKPCPFCGGEPQRSSNVAYDNQADFEWFEVKCSNCTCSVGPYETTGAAIEAWNARWERTYKCAKCGVEYEPTNPEQKYCSKECKNGAYVDRRVLEGDGVPPWFAKQFGAKVVEQ